MELEDALNKIAELEEELSKTQAEKTKIATDKEGISKSFEEFRQNATQKEKELSEKVNSLSGEYDGYKKQVETKETERKTKFIQDKIAEKARGDKDLIEKITNEYKNFNLPEDNEEGILTRIEKASALHTRSGEDTDPAPGGGSGKPDGASNNNSELQGNAKGIYDYLAS